MGARGGAAAQALGAVAVSVPLGSLPPTPLAMLWALTPLPARPVAGTARASSFRSRHASPPPLSPSPLSHLRLFPLPSPSPSSFQTRPHSSRSLTPASSLLSTPSPPFLSLGRCTRLTLAPLHHTQVFFGEAQSVWAQAASQAAAGGMHDASLEVQRPPIPPKVF